MSHPNARLIVYGRGVLVSRIEAGWTVSAAAHAAGGAAAPVPQDPQGPSASQGRSALPRMAPQDSPIDDLCGPEALRALTLKHPHVQAGRAIRVARTRRHGPPGREEARADPRRRRLARTRTAGLPQRRRGLGAPPADQRQSRPVPAGVQSVPSTRRHWRPATDIAGQLTTTSVGRSSSPALAQR